MKKILVYAGLLASLTMLCNGVRKSGQQKTQQGHKRGWIKKDVPQNKKQEFRNKHRGLIKDTTKQEFRTAFKHAKRDIKTQLQTLTPEQVDQIIAAITQVIDEAFKNAVLVAAEQKEFVGLPDKRNGTFVTLEDIQTSNKAFMVNAGDYLILQIPENPGSTGIMLGDPDFAIDAFSLEQNIYLPPKPGLIGAGGQRLFVFKALNPTDGQTTITIPYGRSWEDQNVYTVNVGINQPTTQPEDDFIDPNLEWGLVETGDMN